MIKIFPSILFTAFFISLLSGCGTSTPIPAQGGGKRFAIEQALISASARKAIENLPLEKIDGKNVMLEVSIIQDEGGGAITFGGRPYAASILTGQVDRVVNRTSTQSTDTTTNSRTNNQSIASGGKVNQSEPAYNKDMTYNGSDAKQFSNLVVSSLLRRNVFINPPAGSGKAPEYVLEILVDIFGIWRSRTDWMAYNAETLMATTSFEYVLTPLMGEPKERTVARVGFDATYKENYIFWIGPYDTEIYVKPSKFSEIVGSFGIGTLAVNNVNIEGTSNFIKSNNTAPIILNPTDSNARRTGNGNPAKGGLNF